MQVGVVYDPNFEKVDGAYCFWSVRGCVRHTFCTYCNFKTVKARVLKFHVWIPNKKIADPYFFFSELSPLLELWPFENF